MTGFHVDAGLHDRVGRLLHDAAGALHPVPATAPEVPDASELTTLVAHVMGQARSALTGLAEELTHGGHAVLDAGRTYARIDDAAANRLRNLF